MEGVCAADEDATKGDAPQADCFTGVILVIGLTMIHGVNHYSRDFTGPLELELAKDLSVDSTRVQLLNTAYFLVTLPPSLVLGVVAQRIGVLKVSLGLSLVALCGYTVLGVAGWTYSYPLFLTARLITGFVYEPLDNTAFPMCAEAFPHNYSIVVGFFQSGLRAGSVACFFLVPAAYKSGGLPMASATVTLFGVAGMLAACTLYGTLRNKLRSNTSASSSGMPLNMLVTISASERWQFWAWVACGMTLYGSVVPIWFVGSSLIQAKWGYGLQEADALMALPEGAMVVLSAPIGIALSRARCETVICLLSCALALQMMCFFGLAWLPTAWPPEVLVASIGALYAFTNQTFWTLYQPMVPESMRAIGIAICSIGMNLGPSILPLVMANMPPEKRVALLGLVGFGAVLTSCALLVMYRKPHRDDAWGTSSTSPLLWR